MIVLDANILLRAVLGQRVRHLLETYSVHGIQFYSPQSCFVEAATYLPSLLQRKGQTDTDPTLALKRLEEFVAAVEHEDYVSFEAEARLRLRKRDEDDWPVLATALALNCPIWTEDADFFGTGHAIWTTDRIEMFLKAQLKSLEARDEPE